MFASAIGAAITITAIAIAIAIADEGFSVGFTCALLFLAAVAAQRESVFADETAVSGSVVVVTAGIVGAAGDSLLIPVLCSIGAAMHLAHVRQREFLKMLVNMGSITAPALVASASFRAISIHAAFPVVLIGIVVAVCIYWLLNNVLIGVAMSFVHRTSPRTLAWELVRSETAMLAFAFGGAICGLVMVEVSRWTGIAALVALLIALDVFVISVPAGPATLRSAWKMIVSRVVGAAVGGVVGAAVPKVLASAFVGALVGGVLGLAAGLATVTLVALVRLRRSGAYLDRTVLVGFVLAEVALPAIGTAAGVVGALAGLGPGIATAAGLVIAASFVAGWRRRATNDDGVDDDLLLAAVTEAMFDGLPHPANRT